MINRDQVRTAVADRGMGRRVTAGPLDIMRNAAIENVASTKREILHDHWLLDQFV